MSHSEAAFDLEESFRRAEAARGMSMDVSRVLGIDSWPVEALMSGVASYIMCLLIDYISHHVDG